jgi:hypothetical protein
MMNLIKTEKGENKDFNLFNEKNKNKKIIIFTNK